MAGARPSSPRTMLEEPSLTRQEQVRQLPRWQSNGKEDMDRDDRFRSSAIRIVSCGWTRTLAVRPSCDISTMCPSALGAGAVVASASVPADVTSPARSVADKQRGRLRSRGNGLSTNESAVGGMHTATAAVIGIRRDFIAFWNFHGTSLGNVMAPLAGCLGWLAGGSRNSGVATTLK